MLRECHVRVREQRWGKLSPADSTCGPTVAMNAYAVLEYRQIPPCLSGVYTWSSYDLIIPCTVRLTEYQSNHRNSLVELSFVLHGSSVVVQRIGPS